MIEQSILLGRGREIHQISADHWKQHLDEVPEHSKSRLAFITEEHHQVRYYVVKELPRAGVPISAQKISQALNISLERVFAILDDLEKNLVFLVRGDSKKVLWAFPVILEKTPHRIHFSSGEKLYAA